LNRLLLRTLARPRVDEFIEIVEGGAASTVNIVPPIADKVLLVEHGAIGAKESVSAAISLADPENLALSFWVTIEARVLLSLAVKVGLWDRSEDWVVFTGNSTNWVHGWASSSGA
jgi:hypothetical protein